MAAWSRDNVMDFIERYRSNEVLWNTKAKSYSDKEARDRGYRDMVSHIKIFEPKADRDFVVRKINNLRSTYRKQNKKLRACKLSGDPEPEPKLWYFNALDFLREVECPRVIKQPPDCHCVHTLGQMADQQDMASESDDFEHEEETDIKQEAMFPRPDDSAASTNDDSGSRPVSPSLRARHSLGVSSTSSRNNHSRPTFKSKSSRKRRAVSPADTRDHMLTLALDRALNTQGAVHYEDEFDSIGKTVAHKLRKLPHELCLNAQKLILDVLCSAELGTLSGGTVLHHQETMDHAQLQM